MKSPFKDKILAELEFWPYSTEMPTTYNISKTVNCSRSMAFECLRELFDEGKVIKKRHGKSTYYIFKKPDIKITPEEAETAELPAASGANVQET